MSKQNCWEFTQCGREPGGHNSSALGVCPAATFTAADGFLGGINGGRGCSYVTGTFCGGRIQGTHKDKEKNCAECDFYKHLKLEHGAECSVIRFNNYVRDVQGKVL